MQDRRQKQENPRRGDNRTSTLVALAPNSEINLLPIPGHKGEHVPSMCRAECCPMNVWFASRLLKSRPVYVRSMTSGTFVIAGAPEVGATEQDRGVSVGGN